MTDIKKPEALRLAAQLEDTESARLHLLPYAAAELRRLHDENERLRDEAERLREVLEGMVSWFPSADTYRRLGFDPEAPMRALKEAKAVLRRDNSND